jgi:outer membrane protein
MTKKLLTIIACLLPISLFAQDSKDSKDLKFGYVNYAEIFQGMPETVAATKKLEDLQKNYKTELDKIQDEYQKKGSEFVAQRDSLPETIRTRRMTEIQDLEQRLNSFYQDSQKDIQKQQQDLVAPINLKLLNAIKAVGQENGFVYIFDMSSSNGLMYWSVDKCTDVTNLVRTKLNLK